MAQWLFVAQGERRTPLPPLRYLWERGFLGVVLGSDLGLCGQDSSDTLKNHGVTRVTRPMTD